MIEGGHVLFQDVGAVHPSGSRWNFAWTTMTESGRVPSQYVGAVYPSGWFLAEPPERLGQTDVLVSHQGPLQVPGVKVWR